MPQTSLERNSFVKGLITEATPLTFPENASLDEDNFVLNRDGSRQRRQGLDYELNYVLTDTGKSAVDFNSIALTSYKWENVADNAATTVAVIQVGNILYILDLGEDSISSNILDTITLPTRYTNTPIQYTPIKGVLVLVSSADIDGPQYITRDSVTSYSTTSYTVDVRDIWGVDDGLDVDERPTSLTDLHEYNLLNQGWTEANFNAVAFPSNSDVMQFGKDASDNFSSAFLKKQFFGNTPAVKGKHIISAYTRGASRTSITSMVVPVDQETGSATTAATYAGRIFYAGINSSITGGDDVSPSYTGTIFFSRIIDNVGKLGQCYQEADPTSEHVSDLLATDGGSINIPEASNIYKLITKDNSLVVIAENGVWEITGPDGVFRADDFSISQITNVGAIGGDSVIIVESSILYWSDGGIYVLASQDSLGKLEARNLSESTIQGFYNAIPSLGKLYAKAHYDASTRKVSWLYNDLDSYTGASQSSSYNRELVLDTVLNAFYPTTIQTLDVDSPYVAGYISVSPFVSVQKQDNVVVNGVSVVVNGEQVVVTTDVRGSGQIATKYLVIKPSTTFSFTVGLYNNPSFLDWEKVDNIGKDAPAFLLTGYELFADSMRRKYIPYLFTHFRRTETGFTDTGGGNLTPVGASGCLVQAQWDFANSINSGKFGKAFQAYRITRSYIPVDVNDTFDYGNVMITTKNKLRGSGRALSLRFDSEPLKNVHIYGWAMSAEGNQNV